MLVILLPYDRGYPHQLWCDGKAAVISEASAGVLRTCGIGLSSEHHYDEGRVVNVQVNYPSPHPLDLAAARHAVAEGKLRLSKKAQALLR